MTVLHKVIEPCTFSFHMPRTGRSSNKRPDRSNCERMCIVRCNISSRLNPSMVIMSPELVMYLPSCFNHCSPHTQYGLKSCRLVKLKNKELICFCSFSTQDFYMRVSWRKPAGLESNSCPLPERVCAIARKRQVVAPLKRQPFRQSENV
jgi:hypothetical protein